ncbi:hypothetical protein EDC04DRAFT_3149160 [Pisolithus marmoratus]|nr:hypothetical protein EDC04DRAFT_3149160 [Pisolithus marmoratus]
MSTLNSRGDTSKTDFLTTANRVSYISETFTYLPTKGTITLTRRDPVGGLLQVGVIERPANPDDRPQNKIGGDDEDELVHVGFFKAWNRNRKPSTSLFVPPEGIHILDDIIVTFVYFDSQWRDRKRFRART